MCGVRITISGHLAAFDANLAHAYAVSGRKAEALHALRSMIHARARDHLKQIGINYRDPQSYTRVLLGRVPCQKLFY
jgi:hypothetical protein